MTKDETESLLKFAATIYPNARIQDWGYMLQIWTREFANDTRESVAAGFRAASAESPEWMPTIPMIQAAIRRNAEIRPKTDDDAFRDSHCGRSPAEWKALCDWEQSEEGRRKISMFRERLESMIGGRRNGAR